MAVLGRDVQVAFRISEVVALPPGFVTGEESAVISVLGRGVAAPATKPPLPVARGLGTRPTMVSNAETFAHRALIARHGATRFCGVGTPDEPGSSLVTPAQRGGPAGP